jgi:hypothetical protein
MFALPGQQVYMTGHWEERLPLAAVLDACGVAFMAPGCQPPQQQQQQQGHGEGEVGVQQYVCSFFYDHVNLALRPLAQDEHPQQQQQLAG